MKLLQLFKGKCMKYSNEDNIKIVVDLLKANNITNLVLSPGGTNIPLIRAVQNDDFFYCYSVVDERSAAYIAIGMSIQLNSTVALICTSAQATRNYIPGLTEAFYKRVPILAITMEKHPRFKYQEYMQAPDQTSLPRDSIKRSFELPYIADINDYYHSIRLTNQAINEISRNGKGPVQLCIPWLDFPLSNVRPSIRKIKRYDAFERKSDDLSGKKILLVVGEHLPFTEIEKDVINSFCEKTNTVVYVNHLSNFSNNYTVEANLLLASINDEELEKIKPQIIISIGGQTGDYPFFLAFSKNKLEDIEHWRVCADGDIVDTYDKLARVYQGSIIDFFSNISSVCDEHSFFELWKEKVDEKKNDIDVPFSNVSIAQYLSDKIPKNSIVQFSILNSLRVWNLFHMDESIECYSNVGAFGIDGGMSTLIGQSIVSDKLSFMVIGDLAFFYDMNCLGIRHISNNVRILLINNNGGIEFKLHGEDKEIQDKYIAAANYRGSARGWAESCGFYYYSANNMTEFINASGTFISYSDKPILLEVIVSDEDESEAYLSLIDANRSKTTGEALKSCVKNIVGESSIKKIKKVIKG